MHIDFPELYHFLFETTPGIGVLVLSMLVLSTLVAALLEIKTRKAYVDRGNAEDEDEWDFFSSQKDEADEKE